MSNYVHVYLKYKLGCLILKVKFETPHNVKKSTPTRFEDIRVLDEKENWSERTAVVTKAQHREYLKMAQEIMLEVINKLPL